MNYTNQMKRCENCGNEYQKAFLISMAGKEHIFDSFECAINVLAPRCTHCHTRIIGHGVEAGASIFCCVHCAKSSGVEGLNDHV